mgnify:CR=1 FL=1
MSKKKNVIARVGNFEITKESGAEHDYIRIKAISGSWGITHRDDSPMYGAWLMMCKDPEYRKGMGGYNHYVVSPHKLASRQGICGGLLQRSRCYG